VRALQDFHISIQKIADTSATSALGFNLGGGRYVGRDLGEPALWIRAGGKVTNKKLWKSLLKPARMFPWMLSLFTLRPGPRCCEEASPQRQLAADPLSPSARRRADHLPPKYSIAGIMCTIGAPGRQHQLHAGTDNSRNHDIRPDNHDIRPHHSSAETQGSAYFSRTCSMGGHAG
jgi:hypothetical protein